MPPTDTDTPSPDIRSAIGKAALIILVLTMADKVLALLKEMLIAADFGVGPALDAFNLAYAVPGLIGLLFNGAVISAFVPLYVDWRRDYTPQEVRDRTMTVFTACLAGSLAIAGLGFALSPTFFPLLGYGFSPEQIVLGVEMERMLMALVVLEGISAFLAALLRAWKAFAAVTAAQFPINIALILYLYLGQSSDIRILVYGTLAGTVGKTLWLLVAVARDFSYITPFRFEKKALADFLALAFPLLGSVLIANSNILVDQSMATQLSPGGVSTLRYASRISDLPLQLIVLAISRAILPFISELASAGDMVGLRRIFGQSLASLGGIAFPAIAFVMLFADDIVVVLLRRGAFDATAAAQTALTLRYYTAGLFFFSYAFINGAFYCALKRTRALLVIGLLTLGVNFGLNSLFLHLMGGVEGIALSSTVTGAILTVIFIAKLSRPLGLTHPFRLGAGLIAPAAATLAGTALCLALRGPIAAANLPVFFRLGASFVIFCLAFLPALIFFEAKTTEEFQPLWNIPGVGRLLARKASKKNLD
jgi:putative peptidoglycan lipid II flippase